MNTIRVAAGQINSTLGDFEYNTKKIIEYIKEAQNKDADIIIFPELAISGYPPEDLVYKKSFLSANLKSIQKILPHTKDIIVIVGFINVEHDIFNSACILYNGEIKGIYNKIFLPNYGVFDEERYFQRGENPLFFKINNALAFGLSICEDIWYPEGPGFASALFNADILLNINASPFHYNKWSLREKMLSIRAIDYGTAIVYCNMVGGQDEIVFDGHSLVINENGEIINRGDSFAEELLITDLCIDSIRTKRLKDPRWKKKNILSPTLQPKIIYMDYKFHEKKTKIQNIEKRPPTIEEEVFKGLVLGLKDYFRKNYFTKAVIGISGGIDSALVSAIATVALGNENVTGVFMPSMFTSKESIEDSKELAKNLGINLIEIPITNIYESYINSLNPFFKDLPFNTTEENIQARIRGNLLMAFSNKFGWLVITTGNKSEMSTGYATLYGDMAGG
ncbi:MAG: NAD+ synthase, partial [Proteobacteria bacterium]|nr:NAD+ synthase [Pseudomonadota bacterium]